MNQVTVSPTPAFCRMGSLNTTRSGSLTVRNAEPTAEPGAPPCTKPARLNSCPDTASQLSSTA